jgi:hypothetical protein
MRKQTVWKVVSLLSLALTVLFLLPQRAAADDDDPPTRVARLGHTDGAVSFEPAGTDDWVTAVINRPMTTGDKLWVDAGARAELHMGTVSIRLGETTGFSFLNLTDHTAQLQLTEGTLRVRVKRLDQDDVVEIDTPNLAFSILRPGTYRINVNEAGDTTIVTVAGGEGEVTGGGQAYTIHANQTATFTGGDQLNADVEEIAPADDFDRWCADRDVREDHSVSARYVSDDAIGYEDLDDNGQWRPTPDYGTVWFPTVATVGWAPYHYGHWVYIAPWGYTWVDDAPWGFAPFHYGRWVFVAGAWGWVPCPPRPAVVVGVAYVRPVYAPALVAWVGGPHFAVGVGIGGGAFAAGVNVGWFPLGPREVYVPSYPVSRTYVNNVNITNTTVNTTVVNNYYNTTVVNHNVAVNNVRYVNQGVPGGVTATTPQAFTSAQPVARNVVAVNQREIAAAPVAAAAPAMTPQRQAVIGAGVAARARPPAAIAARQVVAKTAPPPPPPAFEKQQAAIKQNNGTPLAMSQTRQIQPPVQAHAAAVRIAPPAKPATIPVTGVNNSNRPAQSNKPANNNPADSNSKTDRPPTSRPNQTPLDQQHQQQMSNLQKQQQQEKQQLQQKQEQEHQQAAKQNTNPQQQKQLEQQHQQQQKDLQQKHTQQQQQLQKKQQQEKSSSKGGEKSKNR